MHIHRISTGPNLPDISISYSAINLYMTSALLLIDIQNDYFPGGAMECKGMTDAALNALILLDFFRKDGSPVFFIRHLSVREGAGFLIPGTTGSEIHESVRPLEGEIVIEKNFPNSFLKTDLNEKLDELSVDGLVISGAMSHMCIDATTRAARDAGYSCTVVEDACATRDLVFKGKTVPAESVHASFMAALGGVYADVVGTGDFLGVKFTR